MNGLERFVRFIKTAFGLSRWPWLNEIGGRVCTRVYASTQRGVYRRLAGKVEVKLDAHFRHFPDGYEREGMQVISQFLREGDLALDIGANIGLYSLCMGKLVSPHGRVYAFEPASKSFEALVNHIQLNSLSQVIQGHLALVGNKAAIQRFFEDGTKGTNRVGGSWFDGPETVQVDRPTIVIDEFLEQRSGVPRLIKIDVEGYEFQVLEGARKTLQTSRCPVLCEVHPNLWAELGHDWYDLRAFLEEIGYSLYDLTGKHSKHFPTEERKIFLLRSIN
jgi:FkbM family methyltransferase